MASLTTMPEAADFFSFDRPDETSTKARRVTHREWESVKEEIVQFYINKDQTLAATMQIIEANHGLKASERKWKLKLKEWGFEKHLSTTAMKILVAKAERRALLHKKNTVFLHGKKEISSERIEHFKMRKAIREGPAASPSQKTPANVLYFTPCMNYGADISGDPDARITGTNRQKLITIGEFRAHKCTTFPQYIQCDSTPRSLRNLSKNQAEPNTPVNEPLDFKWETLVGYVDYFCRHWAWSPEEIRIMHPELYSEVAKTIAQELLTIATICPANDSSFDKDSKYTNLPKKGDYSAGALFIQHVHALYLDTNLAMAFMSECQNLPPLVSTTTYELIDKFFQLKLDSSALPFTLSDLALAQLHAARGEDVAAEEYYREVLQQKFCGQSDRLQNQIHFSSFLIKLERQHEAILMLVTEYTRYLSDRWPTAGLDFLIESPHLDHDALKFLHSFHSKVDRNGTSVCASLSRLLGIDTVPTVDNMEKVLLELMRLGAAYSEKNWRRPADLVYGIAVPRLEGFHSRTHSFERACVFRDLARYRQMHGSQADQLKHFKSAYRCIEVANLYHIPGVQKAMGSVHLREKEELWYECLPFHAKYTFLAGPPGPLETHFESMAREDPQLSRWIHGEAFESVLST